MAPMEPTSKPPAIAVKKTPAEEPFVLCAMVSLIGAATWIVLRPQLLAQFFYSPELLALTHLMTLGFASSITLGIMLRLAPEALKVAPLSRRFALVEAALWIIGVSGLVYHFEFERFVGMAWSALLLLLVTVLRAVNFSPLWRAARAGDWSARWVATGVAQFVLAAALGSSFALLRVWGVGGRVWVAPIFDRLGAHLHVALLGWLGSVIFGFQLKLLPGTRASPKVELARYLLHQGGVLGLAAALLSGAMPAAPFAVAIALSLASRSVPALAAFRRNQAGRWETVAHAVLLVLAATGVLLACGVPSDDSDLRPRVEFAYGFVALFGWIVLTVAGTSWKLFSAWVWLERFWPEKQRGADPASVPAASQLTSPILRDLTGALLLLGVGGIATGMVLAQTRVIVPASYALLGGVVLFVVHFLRIARWELFPLRWKPPAPTRR